MLQPPPSLRALGALYAATAAALDGAEEDPECRMLLDEALDDCPMRQLVAGTVISVAEELSASCPLRGLGAPDIARALARTRSVQKGPSPHSALLLLSARYLDGGLATVELAIAALCEAHPSDRLRAACIDLVASVYGTCQGL